MKIDLSPDNELCTYLAVRIKKNQPHSSLDAHYLMYCIAVFLLETSPASLVTLPHTVWYWYRIPGSPCSVRKRTPWENAQEVRLVSLPGSSLYSQSLPRLISRHHTNCFESCQPFLTRNLEDQFLRFVHFLTALKLPTVFNWENSSLSSPWGRERVWQ